MKKINKDYIFCKFESIISENNAFPFYTNANYYKNAEITLSLIYIRYIKLLYEINNNQHKQY